MLHVFHLDVAYVLQWLSGVLQVFQTYVACVLAIFGRMLQVFHLNVAKVDLMLHMLQRNPSAAATGVCHACAWKVEGDGSEAG
jgi:hypothetical protein